MVEGGEHGEVRADGFDGVAKLENFLRMQVANEEAGAPEIVNAPGSRPTGGRNPPGTT